MAVLRTPLLQSFEIIKQNEKETASSLPDNYRQEVEDRKEDDPWYLSRFYYISDIHLVHKICNAKCETFEDIMNIIEGVVNDLAAKVAKDGLLLINGDTSSNFKVFQLFVKELHKKIEATIVFTLGNHELWNFPGTPLDEIVETYRSVLANYGMYLLHNEVLYKDGVDGQICKFTYEDLSYMETSELNELLIRSRWAVLGGTGFSGRNKDFNADHGIYRKILDREVETWESEKFEQLYDKLYPILKKRDGIIMTHMPKKDWHKNPEYDPGVIYVSGHTHKNTFRDDGQVRVYADNQSGYDSRHAALRSFLVDGRYDPFQDYGDGVYKIGLSQYEDFYRGWNGLASFKRKVDRLFLLKKNGYYCFIHEAKDGSKTILNGCIRNKIPENSLEYYQERMDQVIAVVKEAYAPYYSYQTHIAGLVKQIGGSGKIYGCLVDIDSHNHIYVNPRDLSIVGYHDKNWKERQLFPSIPALLQANCPELYERYRELENDDPDLSGDVAFTESAETSVEPIDNLEIDINKSTYHMAKLQKLNHHLLAFWPDSDGPITLANHTILIEGL